MNSLGIIDIPVIDELLSTEGIVARYTSTIREADLSGGTFGAEHLIYIGRGSPPYFISPAV